MNTLLITGGLGYLGGRILKFLSEKNEFDLRISTRHNNREIPSWINKSQLISLDLTSAISFESACNEVKSIIHLAALNEIDSYNDPEKALIVNSLGTLKLLRAAERSGVKRFIYISTAHVYGTPLQGMLTENTIARPAHPYSITHKTAEDFILSAHDKKDIIGLVLRLSNGFGAPIRHDVERWSLLVNDLCRQAVIKKKLVLRSSGIQQRDFITLLDISRAVYHFINLPDNKCLDGLFNLGGQNALKIIDMANLIADRCHLLLGYKPDIEVLSNLPNEISNEFEYSIKKIESTGFELVGNVFEEIDNTLLFSQKIFGKKS